jgi:cation diffusion facilitator family transporter
MHSQDNFKFQRIILFVGVVLFILKILAWYITGSLAILSDALESIVNIFSGAFGMYSLYLSAQPKDEEHPYGHGKIEFISAAIEGILISIAGIYILYEAYMRIGDNNIVNALESGILLIVFAGIVNYLAGYLSEKRGHETKSPTLIAGGRHLKTDAYSTIGLVLGLVLMYFTRLYWLDIVIAVILATIILFNGYSILRRAVAGIMDEADKQLIKEIVGKLEDGRTENWIDIHNLRVIKYGSTLHIDCHLTIPWYMSVKDAHHEIEKLSDFFTELYGDNVELFVHTDPCMEYSCKICTKKDCEVRKQPFEGRIKWSYENISMNSKHNKG